jgi:dienelactone hydrolase/glycosidase
VPRIEVDLPTPDGPCHATLHVPADGLPVPAAVLFPDAAGPRETFRAVADQLAAAGYAVLLPDVYHRLGDWRPFDAATVFSDPPERERLMTMARGVTSEMTTRDAGAFLAFLAGRPEVGGSRVGVFGYCMGGRAALLVAGRFPDRVGAAASFHGGRLADAADPDSPHRLADRVQAAVYVAAAENDETFPPEQFARLEAAYTAARVQHTMEVYPAAHGFAVPDNATYDAAADERHRAALHTLFGTHLRGAPAMPRTVADLDFTGLGPATPSPSAWADEVLYFLLVDRFSDGREDGVRDLTGAVVAGATPPWRPGDADTAVQTDADARAWRAAGVGWVGGTLAGVRSKLGYLARLGVTALWVSPVLTQAAPAPGAVASNYHGYATQDFLTVDPRFGDAAALRALVDDAHASGLRVILDVVLNHAGDVFAYDPSVFDARWDGREYPVAGWRTPAGLVPFTPEAAAAAWPDGAVHPAELHPPASFTRRGRIVDWNRYPEYVEGDFEGLKDIAHGSGGLDDYRPSTALAALTRAYCWWLAFADLDGFRVDAVKHMDRGATRYFASVVHEFAQSIGKDRFLLVGEITGSREDAITTMELTGLDAALGLAEVQSRLAGAATGAEDPAGYFALFRNSEQIGKDSHTWLRDTVVTGIDDHDLVRQGPVKARLGATVDGRTLAPGAIALTVLTLGIPCLYYGTEQRLDGTGGPPAADRYIREAMFGGEFGAFRSRGRHVFDEAGPLYTATAALLALRRAEPALGRGRQYLREISADGSVFGVPTGFGGAVRSVVGWSRVLDRREVLCVINTDPAQERTAWVTVDAGLHAAGESLALLYGSAPSQAAEVPVEARNGCAVAITLPPAGVAVYA